METPEYRQLFFDESSDIINSLNNLLIDLEKNPDNDESINEIFRLCHTLKGMAGMMGFVNIEKLFHDAENLLDLLRNRKIKAEKGLIDILLESLDITEKIIQNIKDTNEEKIDVSEILERINSISSKDHANIENKENATPSKRREQFVHDFAPNFTITIKLVDGCPIKGARLALILKSIENFAKISNREELFNLFKSKNEIENPFIFSIFTEKDPSLIKDSLKDLSELEYANIDPYEKPQEDKSQEEIAVEEDEGEIKPTTEKEELEKSDEKPQKQKVLKKASKIEFIRLPIQRVDIIMNLIEELVINKIRLKRIAQKTSDKDLIENVGRIDRNISSLQNQIMEIRLIPLEYIYSNYPRLVRNLSSEEGKEVDLILEGGSIGIDKMIIDEINEALIHIIRNAIYHGLETPEIREQNNKPKIGQLKISSRREKNFVYISIEDDGKGLDEDQIKKMAIEKKLITEEKANSLSREEIFNLLTSPNFSSSDVVTKTAGRGVGLDAVITKLLAYEGNLSITSVKSKGTTFTIKLPLSMAIIESLLIKISDQVFAIALNYIVEIIHVEKEKVKDFENNPLIPYRDEVLPLIDLGKKIGFINEKQDDNNKSFSVVVVEVNNQKAGLIVDALIAHQEVVIKSLKGMLKKVDGFGGATILGSGKAALILDIATILNTHKEAIENVDKL
jgi:two-component system, chemotaxis family, sensor kinase CheA